MWQIVGPNGVTNTTGGVAVPLPEAPVPPDTAPRACRSWALLCRPLRRPLCTPLCVP